MKKTHRKSKKNNKRPNPAWKDIVKENVLLEQYYKVYHMDDN